jgi:uncharacterized protein (DUF697 family)/tellurite resistance protein
MTGSARRGWWAAASSPEQEKPAVSPSETRSILSLSLLAAFADGGKHDRERAEIKRIAEGLSQDDAVHLPTLYQDVLMKRVSLAGIAQGLTSLEARQLAHEMAVCVCDADGVQSVAEQKFLGEVRSALGLDADAANRFTQDAEAMAAAPLANADVPSVPYDAADTSAYSALDAQLDEKIISAAITNGALELLPESLSTMAIIPLQMKLVFGIGKAYGYELDRGHIKDFLATIGVGLTSQYLEQAGRKLLGGLLGRAGGGLLRGLGNQAVSSGMSFVATYALGHVAKRYYAGGRTLSTQMLKDTYANVTQEAQGLQGRYLPAIQDKARTLEAGKELAMVRGGWR